MLTIDLAKWRSERRYLHEKDVIFPLYPGFRLWAHRTRRHSHLSVPAETAHEAVRTWQVNGRFYSYPF